MSYEAGKTFEPIEPEIRKIVTTVEDMRYEGFKELDRPIMTVSVAAVIKNPFAGKYQDNLELLSQYGAWLGEHLTKIAADILGKDKVETYGKGCIVGENGELEHSSAILHPALGKPMRDQIGGGKSIIPSNEKVGGVGTSLDISLHFKDAAFVRTHYGSFEVRIPDAPKADEIICAIVLADGGRPHARIGGLQKNEAKCEDGLR